MSTYDGTGCGRGQFLPPGCGYHTRSRPPAVTETEAIGAWMRFSRGKNTRELGRICEAGGIDPRSNEITIARDLETGTGSEGGYTVHAGVVGALVRARSTYGQIRERAKLFPRPDGSSFKVPISDDTANFATVVAEEGDSTGGTDPVFAEADLTPYKLDSKILKISEELMADAQFNMEEYVGTILGERLWRAQERYALIGSGSGEPEGVTVGGTAALTAASAAAVTAKELIELAAGLDPMYRGSRRTTWLMNNSTLAAIQNLVAGDGHPLLRPLADRPRTLLGHDLIILGDMPGMTAGLKPIVLGNVEHLGISEVGGISLQRFDELYRETGQLGFRAVLRTSSAVLVPSAFRVLTMHA